MRTFVALFRREFLEHRGAFFYAPLAILGVLALGLALSITTDRVHLPGEIGAADGLRIYEIGLLGLTQIWWWYLLVALFFYYADAFAADRRNNAMLFWKSMPVGDVAMLASKMLAGLLVFPAILFGVFLVSGSAFYLLGLLGDVVSSEIAAPQPDAALSTFVTTAAFGAVHFLLGVLWFAPFFAWVGLLSTIFGRWSIPLAFLIPAVLALLENAAFYGVVPDGGYVYGYLWHRMQFGLPREAWMAAIFTPLPTDASLLTRLLVDLVDWVQFVGGLVVAAVLVVLAGRYRRRGVAA